MNGHSWEGPSTQTKKLEGGRHKNTRPSSRSCRVTPPPNIGIRCLGTDWPAVVLSHAETFSLQPLSLLLVSFPLPPLLWPCLDIRVLSTPPPAEESWDRPSFTIQPSRHLTSWALPRQRCRYYFVIVSQDIALNGCRLAVNPFPPQAAIDTVLNRGNLLLRPMSNAPLSVTLQTCP